MTAPFTCLQICNPKAAYAMPFYSKGGIAWPNGLYCFATWPVLQAQTRRLRNPNGPFYNALSIRQLSWPSPAVAINMKCQRHSRRLPTDNEPADVCRHSTKRMQIPIIMKTYNKSEI